MISAQCSALEFVKPCPIHGCQHNSVLSPWRDGNSNLKVTGGSVAMDCYQSVVADFLDADPPFFINNEYSIRLEGLPPKASSWTCDIMAISTMEQVAHLCEVTFSQGLGCPQRTLAGLG